MRKLWVLLILTLFLTGCSPSQELETVMDSVVTPAKREKMEILISLPEKAALAVMSAEETGTVYFCEDFVLTLQTVESGDLYKTVADSTGFAWDQLPIMETVQGEARRYDCVWTAAGETGDQVGRCAILDDGNYHYILTVMADAEKSGELTETIWNDVFSSFQIANADNAINSGS